MAQADVSSIGYFAPVAAFLLVFLVTYAILAKAKILGDNKWLNIFVSFVISTIFISAMGARIYIQTIVPWFGVMVVALFLLMLLLGLAGGDVLKSASKPLGITFIVLLGIAFLISAFFVFSHIIVGYLPGPAYGQGVEPSTRYFLDWLYSPSIAGTALLIIISAAVAFVLAKGK